MSPLARRRDGRNTTRTVKNLMPTPRRRRVSGAAADRLLDGGDDGPQPLRQLLAAANAPATAAELQGEASARAAFRSSVHATEAPLAGPRRVRARTATAIVTSKIIAALVLTAGTAGGVALATHSYSTNVQQQSSTVGGTGASAARIVAPSGTMISTHASDGAGRSDGSTGADGSDDADTSASKAPEASTGPTTTKGSVTPPGQRDRHTGNPHVGSGATPDKGNPVSKEKDADKNGAGKEKDADKGNGAGKAKNADKGNAVGKEKADKGNGAGEEKDGEKQDKAGGDRPNGAGGKEAGVDNGSGKKKADAGTTT